MTMTSSSSTSLLVNPSATPALARKRRLELLRSNRSSIQGSSIDANTNSVQGTSSEPKSPVPNPRINHSIETIETKPCMEKKAEPVSKRRNTNKKYKDTSSNEAFLNSTPDRGKAKPKRKVKTNIRYDPDVPMTKEETAAWRREARRVRNRESAAASRQKTKIRIEQLETELQKWKDKCKEAEEALLLQTSKGQLNWKVENLIGVDRNNNQKHGRREGKKGCDEVIQVRPKASPDIVEIDTPMPSQQVEKNTQNLRHGLDEIRCMSPCTSPCTLSNARELKTPIDGTSSVETEHISNDMNKNLEPEIVTSYTLGSLPLPSLLSSSTHDFQSLEAQAEAEVEKLTNASNNQGESESKSKTNMNNTGNSYDAKQDMNYIPTQDNI